MSTHIIVADDHPVMSRGIAQLLKNNLDVTVTPVTNGSELMRVAKAGPCDLIISDFNMPGTCDADGFRLLEQLRRSGLQTPVIVMTMIGIPIVLNTILRCRVQGLVHKSDTLNELCLAVESVLRGERYLSTSIQRLAEPSEQPCTTPLAKLTSREADVLRLLAAGYSITDIAKSLNRSVKTISGHKADFMTKLGVTRDVDLYNFVR